jgi:hypothetical protein
MAAAGWLSYEQFMLRFFAKICGSFYSDMERIGSSFLALTCPKFEWLIGLDLMRDGVFYSDPSSLS